jgi:hypothetical protein
VETGSEEVQTGRAEIKEEPVRKEETLALLYTDTDE